MPKQRSPNRQKAWRLWKESGEKRPLKDIAEELGVSETLVRKWKSQDKWEKVTLPSGKSNGNEQKKKEKVIKKLLDEVDSNEELTERQRLFCLYYVSTFNATSSYQKAFDSIYSTANTEGAALLAKPCIRAEIKRLKDIKRMSLLLEIDDIVEKQMKIAFADMSDFIEWGREEEPVMAMYGPVTVTDEETGEKVPLTRTVNTLRFKESAEVDGTLVNEIKLGRNGTSIKLADRQKALQWLSDYFLANPMDRHKVEYDKRRAEIEVLKAENEMKDADGENMPDDGFIKALSASASSIWEAADDSKDEWSEGQTDGPNKE